MTSSDGSMATALNGAPHTALGVQIADGVSALTTSYIDPTLLSVNGVSLEDSNGSSMSDDEVGCPVYMPEPWKPFIYIYASVWKENIVTIA